MIIAIIGTVASSIHGFRADMIKALIKKDHQVYAFFSDATPEDIKKIIEIGAIPIRYKINRGGLNPISDIKAIFDLLIKIKRIKPDIVFSFASKAVIFGTIAAKMSGAPKVYGMLEGLGHSFTPQINGLHIKSKIVKSIQINLYKAVLPLLDTIIFLNPDDPNDLLGKYKINVQKVEILGGIGVDLKEYSFQTHPTSDINFIFIARLLKEKGIYEFVNAAKIVKKIYPEARFTVLGSIDESNLGALRQEQLEDLVSSGIITYPGHVDNVQAWIANSHIFVLPSYYREGVPRSTQEAMAIGRAVITTDVPGCRETVIDGVNGFLVPKWDYQALAQKMLYFIENPEQIEIMGLASHRLAQEKFDAIKVNTRLLKILGL